MTTFALVHGAWHRGSCWEPTAALLRAAGHDVVTPDLPCDDPNASLDDYAATVVAAIGDSHPSGDVVVVGHSLGGLTVPLVAERVPVRELVFLCALVPLPGVSVLDDLYALDDTFPPEGIAFMGVLDRHPDGTSSCPLGPAIDTLYHDCDPVVAQAAAANLRPQASGVVTQPSPLAAYPDVPVRAIVCRDDRIVTADACARHARERLGATVVELGGGHSPMLAQPATLAEALLTGE